MDTVARARTRQLGGFDPDARPTTGAPDVIPAASWAGLKETQVPFDPFRAMHETLNEARLTRRSRRAPAVGP